MNKKLLVGIIAGVAVLLATVIAIIAVSGNFSFTKPNDSNSNDKPDSSDVTSSKVDDNGNTEFTVETEDAKKDSTISIPVLINNNPGFYAGEFYFTYDSNMLEYVDYEEGVIVDQFEAEPAKGAIKLLAYNSQYEDVKKDGVLMTLNFKVKKASADGQYKITVQDEGTMLGSFATEQEVKADIIIGKPEVK